MPGMRADSLAIETLVSRFPRLMLVALISGSLAGLFLFALQHFTIVPLIEKAETYEAAHDEHEWTPAEGWERTSFTALANMLTGIGFAAILFGFISFSGAPVNPRSGILWGLGAFVCFHLAPALGLPPQPPGTAVAGLRERQIWWAGTAIATALGLWLLWAPGKRWMLRVAAIPCLALPHLIGAPVATGQNAVPIPLIRQFEVASLATTGIFWLLLGTIGGFLWNRGKAGP